MYLIETMRAEDGDIPLWAWHRRRARQTMTALGWPLLQIKKPAVGDGMVRMLLHASGEVVIEQRPLPVQPDPYRIGLSPVVVRASDPWLRRKSSLRAPFDAARAWADAHGLHDALLQNERGAVTESTIANLIVQTGGRWYTPPVADGLLPGVMRAVLLHEGRVQEKSLHADDLRTADALFLCNAVRGVFRVLLAG